MNRRDMLKKSAIASAALGLGPLSTMASSDGLELKNKTIPLKGNIKHSVCRWCYESIPFEEFCQAVANMGIKSIDLTGPKEWEIMQKYGLTSAMGWGYYPEGIGLDHFWGEEKNHKVLIKFYEELIPQAKKYGIKNLICHSGNLFGRSTESVRLVCEKGIKQVIKLFEENDITLSMELLNSKVDHIDHAVCHTEWGVTLCEMVGSNNFKLLYDIYHMQIMEGDLIATFTKYLDYISHFHTGGVPGRHIINSTQEIFYPAVMKAIAESNFKGWVAQEFVPQGNSQQMLAQLQEAINICDV